MIFHKRKEKFLFYLSIDIIFNWYLTPTLYDEKYFVLVYAKIFNIGINNLKLVLFSIWYSYCKMSYVYPKKFDLYFQLVFTFNWYQNLQYISIGIKKRTIFHFQLVSKIYKIFSIGIINLFQRSFIMHWYVLLICKGSLTSSLYIDSC